MGIIAGISDVAVPEDQIYQHALAAFQAGKLTDAERLFKKLLRARPEHLAALNLLSILLTQLDRLEEAEQYVRRALDPSTTSDATFYNYGIILKRLKRPVEALEQFDHALGRNAAVAETWNNRGAVLNELGRYREAIADFDKAIAINPFYVDAFCNKGRSLGELKLHDESLAAYDTALMRKPDLAEAWVGRGNVFTEMKRRADALAAFDKALTLKADLAEAWLGRGNIFVELKNYDDALAAFDKALALKSDLAEAWLGRGNVFNECGRYADAVWAYDEALKTKPGMKIVEGLRLHAKTKICDWKNLDDEIASLLSGIRARKLVSLPFPLLSIPASSAEQLQCAQSYIADQLSHLAIWRGERYAHDRIRVAYVSADLNDHPVGRLMAGVFEWHDRSRFETTAISLGPEDDSETRLRLKTTVDRFVDARSYDDRKLAEFIREHEIDIAVDLNGFTKGERLNTFARRPAPIQVNYLGYAGTLGADYYDYILADRIVVPEDQFRFYSEKVAWLPDSYMPSESPRQVSEHAPTRGEFGLPQVGFVFCCFNNLYKITPDRFRVWMRLLKATAGSVLWLSEGDSVATSNLRREATICGVAPERLLFAPRLPDLTDYLARYGCADLFLDTSPYNAHATANDALRAGLPVLTCLGSTFAGRVAASLLNAVGLSDLVTTSADEYEALALKLAHDPQALASFKTKLTRDRERHSLFDTKRFAKHIESAYVAMWEKYQRGKPPASFAVDRLAEA
jgi:predicted O-linked N-acetylglucosamine transferase (SPINDLY family)